MYKEQDTSQHELIKFYNYSTDIPTQSALIQQRSKIRSDAFNFLFYQFTSSFTYKKNFKGYRLLAGSPTVSIYRNIWSKKGRSQMKL